MQTKVGKLDSDHPVFREGYEWGGVCECGYFSLGWPLKKQAKMRIDSHVEEHETGDLMPDRKEVEDLTPGKFEAEAPVSQVDGDVWEAIN
jgi:hypothetical protein